MRVVLLAVLANARELWLPSHAGYTSTIKAFWFGANASGLDSMETLELMSRHAVAGYGWQTGHDGSAVGQGEAFQAAAVAHARAYMDEHQSHANATMLFEYRQVQRATSLFAESALAAADPRNDGFWLRDPETGAVCGRPQPFFNFSNASATQYWLDAVIGQLCHDSALHGGRSAVFFDEVDQGQCGYTTSECNFSAPDSGLQAASNGMLRQMVTKLNDAGIVPILSLDNRLAASAAGLPGAAAPPCALPEDALLRALDGLTWVRFYENWPGSFWYPDSADLHAAMTENALLEANASVPTVLHAGNDPCWACPQPQRTISRPGRLYGSIEYVVASYLIVQSPGTTLSISNGWYDSDFCWWPEFDVEYGTPLGPAVRVGAHAWTRNYTRANVQIDLSCDRHADCLGIVDLLE